ncbi:MAG TPA: capsule assembly Wzi family protein [Bacteroidia bacterium]|nr:capsule assembly Wzi family protein [Bacteroidia bacterium]
MYKRIDIIISVCFFVWNNSIIGQYAVESKNILLSKDYSDALQEWNIRYPSEKFHSVYQPFLSSTILNFSDTCFSKKAYPKILSLALSKVFNDAPNKRNQYQLQVLPIIHSIQGYDEKFTSENGIGTQVYLNINNDFTLYGLVAGYNSSFPYFMDTSIHITQLIPNVGVPLQYKNNRYNYLYWSAYASYSKKFFNVQAGRGKMFVGNGYRSMLLSDIAIPYPYLKMQMNFWKIQYNVFYLLLKHYVPGSPVNSIQNKYSTMHTLSLNLKNFNITFFENVVWQGTDTNRFRGFEPAYLNPVIFYRPQEYQQGSSDNVMMGLNASYIFPKKLQVYGQLALDEFYLKEIRAGKGWWANKQAWQLGIYALDFLGIKNLNLRLEYNEAKPYTYSHGSPAQNYAHYGMPLAHPFGANFREFVGQLRFSKDKWMILFHQVYAEIGKDSLSAKSNVGQNIFLSYTTRSKEYGNYTLQGIRTYFNHSQLDVSYLLIPVMNLRAQIGIAYRANNDVMIKYKNVWVFAGLSCNVFNFYRDY